MNSRSRACDKTENNQIGKSNRKPEDANGDDFADWAFKGLVAIVGKEGMREGTQVNMENPFALISMLDLKSASERATGGTESPDSLVGSNANWVWKNTAAHREIRLVESEKRDQLNCNTGADKGRSLAGDNLLNGRSFGRSLTLQ